MRMLSGFHPPPTFNPTTSVSQKSLSGLKKRTTFEEENETGRNRAASTVGCSLFSSQSNELKRTNNESLF
jgi:hypothetical protein